MLCHNCNCKISDEFKYSITTNCCPKCGQSMMTDDTRQIYESIIKIMDKPDNDLGDVAVWISKKFLKSENESTEVNLETNDEELPPVATRANVMAPKPVRRSSGEIVSKPTNDRTALFAKRAGLENKFQSLIKDIQGEPDIEESQEDSEDIGNAEDMAAYEEMHRKYANSSFSQEELDAVVNQFDIAPPPSPNTTFSEIQKIQKLEQLASTGSLGMIRRSS